ncbi:MAG: hypothetical protein LC749_05055, partial [Actinobacteria bacterium]|nr:hypothetical protein [Actinomycetota bacterium]
MADTMPIITSMCAGLEAGADRGRQVRQLPARALAAGQALARNGGPLGLVQLLLSPYGQVLRQRLTSDQVRAPIS